MASLPYANANEPLNERFFHKPEKDKKLQHAVNTYTLFDGLTDNMCGYFTSCIAFFQASQGLEKMQATCKMSAGIFVTPSNNGFIIRLKSYYL